MYKKFLIYLMVVVWTGSDKSERLLVSIISSCKVHGPGLKLQFVGFFNNKQVRGSCLSETFLRWVVKVGESDCCLFFVFLGRSTGM